MAAPIWAFAHLDTDGEGMGQRTQTGYLFLLNVLFRPGLMVVGLILGAMTADLLTGVVINMYPSIIANSDTDSWSGLIKAVAYIAAFIIILQMIISLSFSMIRFVPDQVLGWAGGNMVNQVGANAEDIVGSASKNAFGARGAIVGAFEKRSQAKRMEKQIGKQSSQAAEQGSQAAKQSSQAAKQDKLEGVYNPLEIIAKPVQGSTQGTGGIPG